MDIDVDMHSMKNENHYSSMQFCAQTPTKCQNPFQVY